MAAPLIKPAIPLVTPIPGGFLNGKLIRIEGAIGPSAQRFAVNLQCGPNTSPRDDIALHLAVNFSDRSVSRNSLNFGQWGREERDGGFPFQQGEGFEILLLADSNHYKLAINGQHFGEFHHRMAPERATHLAVDGEVMLTLVSFEGAETEAEFAPLSSASAPPQAAPIMQTSSPAPVQNPPYGAPPYPMQSGGAPYPPAGAPYGMPPYPPQPGTAAPYPNAPYPAAPPNPYGPPSQYPGGPYAPPPGPYAQGPYPPAPGYPQGPYGYPQNPGQYPPGYGPYPPPPGAYPGQYPGGNPSSGSGGLGGILGKAGAAVAGALGATGLLGLAGNRGPSSYPYPGAAPGYGGSGGGLLGAATSAIGAAAMGSALLNPKKAMKQQHKAQKNALKYGIPAAGVGLGAYALHKGLKHGFHGGYGSSSSSSEEE